MVLASIVGAGGGSADLASPRTTSGFGEPKALALRKEEVARAREIGREERREREFEVEARREAKELRREEKEQKREQQEREREALERQLLLGGKP